MADNREITGWITVKGRRIPLRKGQSKKDAIMGGFKKDKKVSVKKGETHNTRVGYRISKSNDSYQKMFLSSEAADAAKSKEKKTNHGKEEWRKTAKLKKATRTKV